MKSTKKEALKKKQTPSQKKIAKVMHKFKEGDLHSGKTDTIVWNWSNLDS